MLGSTIERSRPRCGPIARVGEIEETKTRLRQGGLSTINQITIFLLEIGVLLVVCLGVIIYLRMALKRILADVCGTENRAKFWTAFTNITVFLVPLVVAMHYRVQTGSGTFAFFEVVTMLRWGLIGLIATVLATGLMILRARESKAQ